MDMQLFQLYLLKYKYILGLLILNKSVKNVNDVCCSTEVMGPGGGC